MAWSVTVSVATWSRVLAVSRLRPIRRPVTSPSRLPSGWAWKLRVTLVPSAVTRTLEARVPRGTRTWIRISPPLTSSGRD